MTKEPMANIRRFQDRQYFEVPIDMIVVTNPRNRDQEAFKANIRSIKDMGQYKPIVVNQRNLKATGKYELICGQGRLEAASSLERKTIMAEVVDVDEELAQIMSLQENLTRIPPDSVEYARSLHEMHKRGMSIYDISKITGRSFQMMQGYIMLMENGEERLVRGVEDGVFPITFATEVARSKNGDVQRVLMDAFDEGIISTTNLNRVRAIVEARKRASKSDKKAVFRGTVSELKADIRKVTDEKKKYVEQVQRKENRLIAAISAVEAVMMDEEFRKIVKGMDLERIPKLIGNYHLEAAGASA